MKNVTGTFLDSAQIAEVLSPIYGAWSELFTAGSRRTARPPWVLADSTGANQLPGFDLEAQVS
jgi:hypothetical protein